MPKKREVRNYTVNQLSTRAIADSTGRTLIGYASVFNSPTVIGDDWFIEEIMPGAFTNAVSGSDVRALFNHDWNNVLGRTKSGTLRLTEDDKGLRFEVDLPDTTIANDLVKSIDRGDIDQCSFGFIPVAETWDNDSVPTLRKISNVELFEISIVSLPAYDDTEVSVRSREHAKSIEKRQELVAKINSILGE